MKAWGWIRKEQWIRESLSDDIKNDEHLYVFQKETQHKTKQRDWQFTLKCLWFWRLPVPHLNATLLITSLPTTQRISFSLPLKLHSSLGSSPLLEVSTMHFVHLSLSLSLCCSRTSDWSREFYIRVCWLL